jgi:hypothetical protein
MLEQPAASAAAISAAAIIVLFCFIIYSSWFNAVPAPVNMRVSSASFLVSGVFSERNSVL